MKKMNSVNGGREVGEDEAKKGKREKQRSGGAKFRPPHLNSAKSWVNSIKPGWSQSTQKKKNDEISFGMD